GSHENSYTAKLVASGIAKVAQKVGEEAVEVVIEAMQEHSLSFHDECADLVFHLLVLLHTKKSNLAEVMKVLAKRHEEKRA
ncbi:MAG: phosphoribosyl-ATP diphosphatase, partial [Bdellovibrionales bacterium]|nr:phosphoribosyl-ATP diphosphatase [Bdellovibrionales bacterium]